MRQSIDSDRYPADEQRENVRRLHEPIVRSPGFSRSGPPEGGTPNTWRPTDGFMAPMHAQKPEGLSRTSTQAGASTITVGGAEGRAAFVLALARSPGRRDALPYVGTGRDEGGRLTDRSISVALPPPSESSPGSVP